ncbi:hypothetical protein GLP30_19810 [Photobacterium phosphoreum]|jgi:predicted ATP-grasp superfamily ATP-dependent carboligase|uniref:Uncharacterized protein n=1 Tax=Photobacterium phosphoreum TaxID=659 RepID=A0AAW5A374_PHOPO|nr:hypothetical protein [Photobacterium phosphoreum]KJF86927.1 hypothetical protein UB41_08500 [Photobacterium phosphoreum]MCD9464950.1 hypothetical protein [Photobacterium phosphoreum]MCD9470984.1 hypothetical protein [Photobacterium phosphoreum]MCD9476488.1 hypothetical protein [Photobacterium phosphoreum]MCD9480335.1 hypothetical protein [Photobacterium phosphoreum]
MAITIRDIDQHYYMIEALKSLTETNVTTKALIKGGYLAVEIGEQLEKEINRRLKAEKELLELKEKIALFIQSKDALMKSIN